MFETLKKILMDEFQIEEKDITMEAELSNDLGINSIEKAELAMQCEEKFNIQIEDENLNRFISIGDVVSYLEEKAN